MGSFKRASLMELLRYVSSNSISLLTVTQPLSFDEEVKDTLRQISDTEALCHILCYIFIFPFIFIHSHSFPLFISIFRYSFSFSMHSLVLRLLHPCLWTPLHAMGSVHLTCPSSRWFWTHHMYCFTVPAVCPSYHFIRSTVHYHM